MKCTTVKGVEYCAYEPNEFDKYHPGAKIVENWRLGKVGDWVRTDDNLIIQIRKRYVCKDNERHKYSNYAILVTAAGTFMGNPGAKMHGDIDKKRNKTSFSNRIYLMGAPERAKCSPAEYDFGIFMYLGMDPVTAYKKAFPEATVPLYIRTRAHALLKTERVQAVIRQEVQDAAKKLGIDEEYILSRIKKICESGDSDKVKLGALRELKDCLDMSPDKAPKMLAGRFGYRQDAQVAISDAEFKVLEEPKKKQLGEKQLGKKQLEKGQIAEGV